MTSTRTMTATSTMLPFHRGAARRHSAAEPRLLIAVEIFLVVLVLDAILVATAISHIADIGSLYIAVT